jgi:hypothetical protein
MMGLLGTALLLLALQLLAMDKSKPISVSNSKNFNGWEGDTSKTFRIQDGVIVGGTLKNKIPRNEFLCTKRKYTNFVLRFKFKLFGEGGNAGVQVRSKRITRDNEVSGYQPDLRDPRWWGCL